MCSAPHKLKLDKASKSHNVFQASLPALSTCLHDRVASIGRRFSLDCQVEDVVSLNQTNVNVASAAIWEVLRPGRRLPAHHATGICSRVLAPQRGPRPCTKGRCEVDYGSVIRLGSRLRRSFISSRILLILDSTFLFTFGVRSLLCTYSSAFERLGFVRPTLSLDPCLRIFS